MAKIYNIVCSAVASFAFVFMSAMLGKVFATSEPGFSVPPGVIYNEASAGLNRIAEKSLKNAIDSHNFKSLFSDNGSPVIAGPFLTQNDLVGHGNLSSLNTFNADLPPDSHMQSDMWGYMAISAEQKEKLAIAINSAIAIAPDYQIRKLTPEEMLAAWYFISWNLVEPLFIVESKGHKYLFGFATDAQHVEWVEDLAKPCLMSTRGNESASSCVCLTTERHDNHLYTDLHSCTQDVAATIVAHKRPTFEIKGADCNTVPSHSILSQLRSYIDKNGNDPDILSIAAIGNHAYVFNEQLNPISPEEIAARIIAFPDYKTTKRILLDWPYSKYGDAPFAHQLEKILHKPVIGYDGPLWWYPDGTAISSHAERSTNQKPNVSNVAQCHTSDGKYHEETECKAIVAAHDASKAIFANAIFVLSCEEVKILSSFADKGDARANMRLYFYNFFVNIDPKAAVKYLTKAAYGNDPLANYLVALSMLNQSPPDEELYMTFLKRVAAAGDKKAIKDLEAELE